MLKGKYQVWVSARSWIHGVSQRYAWKGSGVYPCSVPSLVILFLAAKLECETTDALQIKLRSLRPR